jgi:hypothetical protein
MAQHGTAWQGAQHAGGRKRQLSQAMGGGGGGAPGAGLPKWWLASSSASLSSGSCSPSSAALVAGDRLAAALAAPATRARQAGKATLGQAGRGGGAGCTPRDGGGCCRGRPSGGPGTCAWRGAAPRPTCCLLEHEVRLHVLAGQQRRAVPRVRQQLVQRPAHRDVQQLPPRSLALQLRLGRRPRRRALGVPGLVQQWQQVRVALRHVGVALLPPVATPAPAPGGGGTVRGGGQAPRQQPAQSQAARRVRRHSHARQPAAAGAGAGRRRVVWPQVIRRHLGVHVHRAVAHHVAALNVGQVGAGALPDSPVLPPQRLAAHVPACGGGVGSGVGSSAGPRAEQPARARPPPPRQQRRRRPMRAAGPATHPRRPPSRPRCTGRPGRCCTRAAPPAAAASRRGWAGGAAGGGR